MSTNDMAEIARKHVWLSFGRGPSWFDRDLTVERGEGHYIYDTAGKRYFDGMSGQGSVMLGYSNAEIIDAIVKQLHAIAPNPSGWPVSVPMIQLAQKIASLAPRGLTRTFFSLSGTDANETAVKIARQYWKLKGQGGKYKVIARWSGYHGSSMAMSGASGYPNRRRSFEPLPQGFVHVKPPFCYRCPYSLTYPSCGVECAEEIRKVVEYEDPSTIACYLGELTIAGGGVIAPPPGYVERVRQICDQYGILMITDEVVTGFGKMGTWFESEQYDATPDIITMGKALSNGYVPLSATAVREEIAEAFEGKPENFLHHGYTSGGMPLACAAALATIGYIERHDLLSEVPAKSKRLAESLAGLTEASPLVGDVRVRGLLAVVDLVKDKKTKASFDDPYGVSASLFDLARAEGIYVYVRAPRLMYEFPLTITDAEIDFIAGATVRIVKRLEAVAR